MAQQLSKAVDVERKSFGASVTYQPVESSTPQTVELTRAEIRDLNELINGD